jgi:hypothetical protein
MPAKPTLGLITKFRALCAGAFVGVTKSRLHGFSYNLFCQWHGGQSLTNPLKGADVSIIECGKAGRIVVVLPLEFFLELCQQSEPHVPSSEPILESEVSNS